MTFCHTLELTMTVVDKIVIGCCSLGLLGTLASMCFVAKKDHDEQMSLDELRRNLEILLARRAKHYAGEIVSFDEIRDKIADLFTDERLEKANIHESVSLIDGFYVPDFRKEVNHDLIIGGPYIPLVMLVGDESGQIYFFALYALFPELRDMDKV